MKPKNKYVIWDNQGLHWSKAVRNCTEGVCQHFSLRSTSGKRDGRGFEKPAYPPSLELVWFTGLFLSPEPTVQPELCCAGGYGS